MMNISRPASAEKPLAYLSAVPSKAAATAETGVQDGEFVIGKLNLVLMILIGLIVLALISREESLPEIQHASGHVTTMEPQKGGAGEPSAQQGAGPLAHQSVASGSADAQSASAAATNSAQNASPNPSMAHSDPLPGSAAEATQANISGAAPASVHTDTPASAPGTSTSAAPAAPTKMQSKRRKAGPAARKPIASAEATHSATSTGDNGHANHSVQESAAQKEAVRKMLVFNIWSVSELRLRTAFASYLNDSAIPAQQLETRKRDYLDFVSQRSKKCGDLDNKFLSNINTYEKLTIHKHEIDALQCHATENNIELDKLNL